MKKFKFLITVGTLFFLAGTLTLFVWNRIRTEHDLVACQSRVHILLASIEVFQKDNENRVPDSLNDLSPGYFEGEPSYFDSSQKRSIRFDYHKKGNSLMLSSGKLWKGWAGRPVRVLAFNSNSGVITVPEEQFDSELKKFEEGRKSQTIEQQTP